MDRSAASACILTSVAAVLAIVAPASAQGELRPAHVEPPPAPDRHHPLLLAQFQLGAVVPLERTDICPGDSLCVLGAGGTFGIEIERRWPFGLGVSVAYDAWFVDSGGVFELGVVQIVRAALRYVFAYEWLVHPAVHVGAGALVFGDSLLVSTVGGAVEAGVSAEIELSESVALTAGARAWLFTTSPFTTDRDRTLRSNGLGLNAALQFDAGLLIVTASGEP